MRYYVSACGPLKGYGTKDRPFRKIQQAAEVARPGDEVIVLPGIYRELVNPKFAGTDEAPIVYRASEYGRTVITGAEIIKNWVNTEGDVWKTTVPNSFFGGYNPYTEVIYGDWYRGLDRINHLGMIYFNGKALVEEDSYVKMVNGKALEWAWDKEYSKNHKWFTEQDGDNTVLYARFPEGDPNENCVEINVRRRVFFPEKTGINYITVQGFVLKQAATQWAPPTAFQEGLIGPHWSKGWVIEDCEISDSRCSGISLGKCWHPSNNRWTSDKVKDGTQLERDIILYAQHTGWSKETVGSHVVRRCKIYNCGQTGICGHLGGVFSVIEDNDIHDINTCGEFSGSELGGIKLHAPIDTIIRRNHIHHCHRGIWLDWQTQGTRVTQNLFHDNDGIEGVRVSEDLYIEVSHGPALVDNNLFLSNFALRERSQGLAFVHNIIAGPIDIGSSGGRFTPYHFHHETDVMGFMTILNGDNRFYNNVFIQRDIPEEFRTVRNLEDAVAIEGMNTSINTETGLQIYNDFPLHDEYYYGFTDEGSKKTTWGRQYDYSAALPMYVSGNVYYNGAQPYKKETDNHVDNENVVSIELIEKDGKYILKTNLYDFLPRDMKTQFISTAFLGIAFQPEMAYENPDGSPIFVNEDYLGNPRDCHPLPGPFEKGDSEFVVWVDED
ncbi:MAG: right-handed parallel beta-helix repeat-containing protein [Bacillota bacterium]|nr:right-handed parallel beta-helix repeat-containing protein [Bacillota bacterium]